ncbi:MAG: N-acetyl-gamma-glutamyl-phosphate reductase [Candidatus Eremiobacteraeota bacterium]|nr:N-acetyl-gamma-glutamyl-phosphate reductase [Candidatus Eremiobacteraeota bacterium]
MHVWGASGYGAAEAIRLLAGHPHVELGALESASHAGQPLAAHFPLLRSNPRSFDARGAVAAALEPGDFVVMGGAHGSAVEQAPAFVAAGARVIELSADFRADARAVYGLPERYYEEIARADLVANPGCYPTASLLALLPLSVGPSTQVASLPTLGMTLKEGLCDAKLVQIVIDAKSGITGAGRNPSTAALYAEVAGDIRAYGLGGHRHESEIVRELGAGACSAPLVFTPHVVPLARGMLADCYAIFDGPQDASAVRAAYGSAYAGNPFVRVLADGVAPSVAAVVGTNDAEIAVSVHGNVVRAICAIDNLGKGAAGQAVQNLNIMLGLSQECGLRERVVVNQ